MASKKPAKVAKTEAKTANKKPAKRVKKNTLPHIEFSKITVGAVIAIAVSFLIFVCRQMSVLGDLSPASYIAPSLFLCVGIVVYAYMKRAYQKDLVELEIEKTKKLSALKKQSGEDFVYERIEDVDLTV